MKQRGLTLVELMTVITLGAMIFTALGGAFAAASNYRRHVEPRLGESLQVGRFESGLRSLLESAYLSSAAGDTATYFISAQSRDSDLADALVFTTLADRVSLGYTQEEGDLEDLNARFGPQGGPAEIQFGLAPVGQPPADSQGLFVRRQRPSDGDPTQGGREMLYGPGVQSVTFEFFDGLNWVPDWNTNEGTRRLPAAVRLTYALEGESVPRTMIVRLRYSDVTPENPALQEAAQ